MIRFILLVVAILYGWILFEAVLELETRVTQIESVPRHEHIHKPQHNPIRWCEPTGQCTYESDKGFLVSLDGGVQ